MNERTNPVDAALAVLMAAEQRHEEACKAYKQARDAMTAAQSDLQAANHGLAKALDARRQQIGGRV